MFSAFSINQIFESASLPSSSFILSFLVVEASRIPTGTEATPAIGVTCIFTSGVHKFCQKSRRHLKILGARTVT